MAKVPTAPRDGAGRNFGARRVQPRLGARELGVGLRELEAEGRGLGMDAVAAADRGRELVLEGALLQRGQQPVEIGEQQVGGAHELHVEAGVEYVGGGEAGMHEAGLGPDVLGQVREEGDDVVLDLALDLVDAGGVELGLGALVPDRLGGALGDQAELGHGGGGMRLDLEPDAKARLGRPDLRHLGPACSGGSWPPLAGLPAYAASGSRGALAHQRQVRHIVGKRQARHQPATRKKPRDAP